MKIRYKIDIEQENLVYLLYELKNALTEQEEQLVAIGFKVDSFKRQIDKEISAILDDRDPSLLRGRIMLLVTTIKWPLYEFNIAPFREIVHLIEKLEQYCKKYIPMN